MRKTCIGVMGGTTADETTAAKARQLGALIAETGWVLISGGRPTGVMQASITGAHEAGGLTVGVLFEVYDLPTTDAPYRLSFELVSEDDGSRTAVKVRPAGQETWGLEWLRAPAAGRTVEYVTLDLSELPAGRYTIRSRIDLENGVTLTQELPGLARHVALPATQIPRGGWESEWEMGLF